MTLQTTVIFSLTFVAMIVFSIARGDGYGAITELCCLLLLWVPMVLAIKDVIHLPWPMIFCIGLALFLHSLGLVTNWYNTTFVWDKITHLTSGIVIGLLVAIELLIMDRRTKSIDIPIVWYLLLITISVLSLEGIWEMMEYTFDLTLGTHMQHSMMDTANDIVSNAISGIVAGGGVVFYLSRSSVDDFISNLRADKLIDWITVRFGKQAHLR